VVLNSSVGTTTRCGLGGPVIGGGEILRTHPVRPWQPPASSNMVNGYTSQG